MALNKKWQLLDGTFNFRGKIIKNFVKFPMGEKLYLPTLFNSIQETRMKMTKKKGKFIIHNIKI